MSITRDEIPVKIIPIYKNPNKFYWVFTDAGTGDGSGGTIEFTGTFQGMNFWGGHWLFDVRLFNMSITSYTAATQLWGLLIYPQMYGTYPANDILWSRTGSTYGSQDGNSYLGFGEVAGTLLPNIRFKPTGDVSHIGTYPFVRAFISNINTKVHHVVIAGFVYNEEVEGLYTPS